MSIFAQLAVMLLLTFAGHGLSALLPIPFPGSVISMLLLFLLLVLRIIKVEHIRSVGAFLTGNMTFFFIPAGVGILENWGILRENLVPLLVIAVATTFLTFVAAAFTVRAVMAWQARRRK